jgi:sec-independent protein translocase protein TatB
MPSFGDTALIAMIALLLFGPKKLPELARQLGKLMGEFRRASNEFKMQMEDELRLSEQEEQQKKIAAMQAAAPISLPQVQDDSIVVDHPHMPIEEPPVGEVAPVEEYSIAQPDAASAATESAATEEPVEVLPIASSGELDMMPPSTGLPVQRSSSSSTLSPVLDAIPHTDEAETAGQPLAEQSTHEASVHG